MKMAMKSLNSVAVMLVLTSVLMLHSASYAGFTDIGANLTGSNMAWGDYDNDGDLDLATTGYANTGGAASRIYRNDSGTFVNIGAALTGISGSIVWGDYDSDGDLDLALAGAMGVDTTGGPIISKIYRNDGGAFVDIAANLAGVAGSLAWGDYDNDGDLDLALAGNYNGVSVSKIYCNVQGNFVDIRAPLTAVSGKLAWGDYDNDGDLDLAAAGSYYDSSVHYVTKVYRNDGGMFTDTGASLVGVDSCSIAWGDYDNDGDLDLAIAGSSGSTYASYTSKIYRNNDGVFTNSTISLPGVASCSLTWGDYDNDGDLDLALAGNTGSSRISKIYTNNSGAFVDSGISLPGVDQCSLTWGDYDNDGDLDLALAGFTGSSYNSIVSKVYRNDNPSAMNTPPTPPSGLSAGTTGNYITLSWNAATDAQTPASGLSYNVRIGTTPGNGNIFSGMANLSTGLRKIPALGNAQKRLSWNIRCLPRATYYWSVQAVDTAYAGSAWATEQSLAVNSWKMSGYVRLTNNTGVSGVTITTSDNGSTASTDSNGYYELWVMNGWSGSAAASKLSCQFSPAGRSYSNVISNQTNQNYTCYTFTDSGINIQGVTYGAQAWGDYDNDGDLDLAVAGYAGNDIYISRIYRNNNSFFSSTGANLTGVRYSALAWGDYDNDGDLDLAVAGQAANQARISTIYKNNGGSFVDSGINLQGVSNGSLAWGDYDNDGDLDLALAGVSGSYHSKIYRNDKGTFTDTGAPLTGVYDCSLAWGDYDNDGDLDLALAGSRGSSGKTSKIYRNDDGVFSDAGAPLIQVSGRLIWGDYDNDGDLDLALSGSDDSGKVNNKIYHNDNGSFVDTGAAFTGTSSLVAWADCDNDGDIDLVANRSNGVTNVGCIYTNNNGSFVDSGIEMVGKAVAPGDYDNDGDLDVATASSSEIKICRNDYTTSANTPPAAPAGLSSSIEGATATFTWNAATDAQTPAPGLSYNLRVGTAPGKNDIYCGMANTTGYRKLPAIGNAQKRLSWTLKNLPAGTLYWSVQAIDTAYAGSAWAAEEQAVVPDTTPPVITSVAVSPNIAAAGDAVHITVDATDNLAVTSVTADGTILAKTGTTTWDGDISASATLGAHTITVSAADAAGNTATDTSASYKTARVVGSSIGSATLPVMSTAKDNFLFRFWGKVEIIDTTSFWLDDGSPFRIKVIAPGYAGIEDDDYITARGILDPGDPPAITCPAGTVRKLK